MTNTKGTKQNKRFRPVRILLYIIALCIVIGLVKTFLIPPPKPNIAINYVEKLNQLTKPENYNPADNAAPIYEQAFKEFKQMPQELEDIIDRWEWLFRQLLWPGNLEPDELKQLEEWLRLNKKVFDLVALAVEKPYWWVPVSEPDNILHGVKRDYFDMARNISKAMCWQAKISAMNGDMQSACSDFKIVQKMANHIDRKPVMIERLVAGGVRGRVYNSIMRCLAHAEIDGLALNQLQADLNDLSVSMSTALASFEFVLETEKMMTEDSVQRYFTDDGNGDGYFLLDIWEKEWAEGWDDSPASSYPKDFDDIVDYFKDKMQYFKAKREVMSKLESRKITMQKIDKYHSTYSEISKYTPFQLHSQNTSYRDRIDDEVKPSDNFFLEVFLSSYWYQMESIYYGQVKREALITTVAVFRYKNDKGNYPQSLDQLIEADLLEFLPTDPYSDKPLKYKSTGDDFTLYSFGKDFDDDGGTKQYDRKDEDGDNIYWPILKPKKRPPGMPSMPPMPGMPMMPGMMPLPEQPPMDPNMIT